jgi:hypothetical protein
MEPRVGEFIQCRFDGHKWYSGTVIAIERGTPLFFSQAAVIDEMGHDGNGAGNGQHYGHWFLNDYEEGVRWRRGKATNNPAKNRLTCDI